MKTKNNILLVIVLLLSVHSFSQSVSAVWENGNLVFTNKSNITKGIRLGEKDIIYVVPGYSKAIKFNYSKKRADRTSVAVISNKTTYNIDLKRVDAIYLARERRRNSQIVIESILRGLDSYYTGGLIFGISDAAAIVNKIEEGEDFDEDLGDLLIGLYTGYKLNDQVSEAFFAGTYNLATKLRRAKDVKTQDLEDILKESLKAYRNADRYREFYMVSSIIGNTPEKKNLPQISTEISIPFRTRYRYDSEFGNNRQSKIGNLFPVDVRVTYEIGKERNGYIASVYLMTGYLRSPLLYDDPVGGYVPSNQGLNWEAPLLGAGVKIGQQYIWFGGDISAAFLSENYFETEFDSDGLLSFQELSSSQKIRGIIRLKGGIGSPSYGAFVSFQFFNTSLNDVTNLNSILSIGIYAKIIRTSY